MNEIRQAEWRTPGGVLVEMAFRAESSDWNTISAILTHDEYGFADRRWEGVALDIGSHVGAAAIALAADNPGLVVVAVEALPENVAVIRRQLALNPALAGQVVVMEGAADCGVDPVAIAYGATDSEFARAHEFIGGAVWQTVEDPTVRTIMAPAVSLSSLVADWGDIRLLKIDCEGCEWSFLNDPAVSRVEEIRGEIHPRLGFGSERLHELLDATHRVDSSAVVEGFGLFRAVRK